jgi:hypothetical protein
MLCHSKCGEKATHLSFSCGQAQAGRTAVVEGRAQRIVARDVPANLMVRLWSLDLGALHSGASFRGQFEERIKSVIDECEKSGEDGNGVILFIDEVHSIVAGQGASGVGIDVANLLKPTMARTESRALEHDQGKHFCLCSMLNQGIKVCDPWSDRLSARRRQSPPCPTRSGSRARDSATRTSHSPLFYSLARVVPAKRFFRVLWLSSCSTRPMRWAGSTALSTRRSTQFFARSARHRW